jgi:hypothetical protein
MHRPFQSSLRQGRRQIELRPRHRSHRNPEELPSLIRRNLGSMADDSRPPPKKPIPGHLRHSRRPRHDPPKLPGRPVTEHRVRPAGQNRCHPPRLDGQCAIPHRVCALVKAAEHAALQPALYLPSPNSKLIELPPPHYAVLALREVSNSAIDPGQRIPSPRPHLARSAFDTHTVLNALLVAHALDAAAGARPRGAHKAKSPPHPSHISARQQNKAPARRCRLWL